MKNKLLAVLGVSAASLSVFAEGSTSTMDATAASGIVSAATTGLESLLSTVTPYITTLVLAGLAVWAAFVLIRLVKRAFSRAA